MPCRAARKLKLDKDNESEQQAEQHQHQLDREDTRKRTARVNCQLNSMVLPLPPSQLQYPPFSAYVSFVWITL